MISRNWWKFTMDDFEPHVRRIARQFDYPPTPLVRWQRQRSMRMRFTRAVVVLSILFAVVMISPLRAAIWEWFTIGAITVFFSDEPTPTPSLPSLLNLFGETSLEEAQQAVGFTLRQPADFGPPDHVYRQTVDLSTVIMVWLADPARDQPALTLYQIGPNSHAYGKAVAMARNTEVNGQPALWTDVPHILQYSQGGAIRQRQTVLVEGNVLIWLEDAVTYRLETNLSLDEARAIAESLR